MGERKAEFIVSVADGSKFYQSKKPLVAVSGKSNVGKSSLINMLSGNKKLARTSSAPGRTRLINYFDFGDFILCDLPGYGFSKVSKKEKEKWASLLEEFFKTQDIALLISLVDIRHEPTSDDIDMINYLNFYRIPFIVVSTKADKLPKTKIKPQLIKIAQTLKIGTDNIISSSAETGVGKTEIFSEIEKSIKRL